MNTAFHVSGLCKHYPDFSLQDIELTLEEGQIMGLVGVNGAGKTTLLRLLTGLTAADSGQVEVLGQRLPEGQVAAKRDIGFASEDMRLYKSRSLRWHMDLVAAIYPAWDEAYATELLRRFDLRADQVLKGYSHGQRVKALLLLCLARRPKLLLLDEPTTGLDPVARVEVLEALADVLRDEPRSVLFSRTTPTTSSNWPTASPFCTRAACSSAWTVKNLSTAGGASSAAATGAARPPGCHRWSRHGKPAPCWS